MHDTPLAQADADARADFLKRWLRVEGPDKIQAWLRLYTDPAVRRVIAEHHPAILPCHRRRRRRPVAPARTPPDGGA